MMDAIQKMLAEFHAKHAQGATDFTYNAMLRRAEWQLEEALEFLDAVIAGDRVKMADALADMTYLCYGSAHRMDIDLTACIAEVHRSNMTKDVGPDGKAIKGDDYDPPDIATAILGRVCGKCKTRSSTVTMKRLLFHSTPSLLCNGCAISH